MAFIPVYRNEFNDDPGEGLQTFSGNGDWDFTGGELRYRTLGQDCNWWYTLSPPRRGRMPYKYIYDTGITWPSSYRMRYYETQISYVNTPTYSHGTFVFQNGSNDEQSYWLYFTSTGLTAAYLNGNSWTSLASASVTTTGLKIRFLWDRFNWNLYWQYDSTGSGAWTNIASITSMPFWPERIGWYCKNWTGSPTAEVRFAYAEFGYDDGFKEYSNENEDPQRYRVDMRDELVFPTKGGPSSHIFPNEVSGAQRLPGSVDAPEGSGDSAASGPRATGGYTDEFNLLHAGGPLAHSAGAPADGLRLPSQAYNKETQHTDTDQPPQSGYRDESTFPTDGGIDRHTYPLSGRGLRLPGAQNLGVRIGAQNSRAHQPRPTTGFRDEYYYTQSTLPTYTQWTNDIEGHQHFFATIFYRGFFYNATNDPWNDPVGNNLTGYARDGYEYINGVQQVSQAPWATEASGTHRSSRSDFPLKSFICIGTDECVIFDADSLNADGTGELIVWMRFLMGPSGSTYLIGRDRDYSALRDVTMRNGSLFLCSRKNENNGGFRIIDFKQTGQNFHFLTRADDTWWGASGRDITDRNTTGNYTTTGAPTFVIQNEDVWSMDVFDIPTGHGESWWEGKYFVVLSGEDEHEMVVVDKETNTAMWTANQSPNYGDANEGDIRECFVDHAHWYWHSYRTRLVRNIFDMTNLAWSHGDTPETTVQQLQLGEKRHKYVDLPHEVECMASSRNYLYVGTDAGIYMVHRGTLNYWLAYTVPGGGGRGRNNASPPAGELLKGSGAAAGVYDIHIFHVKTSMGDSIPFLTCAGQYEGHATIIRLTDDYVWADNRRTGGVMVEDGAWANTAVLI